MSSTTTPSTRSSARARLLGGGALALALGLSACASGDTDHTDHAGHDAAATSATQTGASSNAPAGANTGTSGASAVPVAATKAWAKALPEPGKMGMTAVFGDLVNRGSVPVTITSAKTSASDHAELHKTAGGKMAPVSSLTIPAGGTLSLAPGGDHVMVMNVMKPIRPGELVRVTLTTSDGGAVEFSAVAKTFTGAGETYAK